MAENSPNEKPDTVIEMDQIPTNTTVNLGLESAVQIPSAKIQKMCSDELIQEEITLASILKTAPDALALTRDHIQDTLGETVDSGATISGDVMNDILDLTSDAVQNAKDILGDLKDGFGMVTNDTYESIPNVLRRRNVASDIRPAIEESDIESLKPEIFTPMYDEPPTIFDDMVSPFLFDGFTDAVRVDELIHSELYSELPESVRKLGNTTKDIGFDTSKIATEALGETTAVILSAQDSLTTSSDLVNDIRKTLKHSTKRVLNSATNISYDIADAKPFGTVSEMVADVNPVTLVTDMVKDVAPATVLNDTIGGVNPVTLVSNMVKDVAPKAILNDTVADVDAKNIFADIAGDSAENSRQVLSEINATVAGGHGIFSDIFWEAAMTISEVSGTVVGTTKDTISDTVVMMGESFRDAGSVFKSVFAAFYYTLQDSLSL